MQVKRLNLVRVINTSSDYHMEKRAYCTRSEHFASQHIFNDLLLTNMVNRSCCKLSSTPIKSFAISEWKQCLVRLCFHLFYWGSCLIYVICFLYLYWGPTRFLHHMMFVSFNTTGATVGTEHMSSPRLFSGVIVARLLVFCVVFSRSLLVIFLFVIVLSVFIDLQFLIIIFVIFKFFFSMTLV
jgi:hypothetical protein